MWKDQTSFAQRKILWNAVKRLLLASIITFLSVLLALDFKFVFISEIKWILCIVLDIAENSLFYAFVCYIKVKMNWQITDLSFCASRKTSRLLKWDLQINLLILHFSYILVINQ